MNVGVFPSDRRHEFSRFFNSLEAAFEIEITGMENKSDIRCAAVFIFGEHDELVRQLDGLHISSLRFVESTEIQLPIGRSAGIRIADEPWIDPLFRGRVLTETSSSPKWGLRPGFGEQVSAWCDGVPVWVTQTRGAVYHHRTTVEPERLSDDEVLWTGFRRGRCLSTLIPVHFLKNISGQSGRQQPPVRASFIIDDPNVHRLSYGYINFKNLVDHAEENNYHVALGMVPVDIRTMNAGTCDLITTHSDRISLTSHGVFHNKHELAIPGTQQHEAEQYLAHGVRLMEGFELRHGIPISRVMIAPYERISRSTVQALVTTRFEGICINGRPHPYMRRPDPNDLLAGWGPATLGPEGLPVFLRDNILDLLNKPELCILQDQIFKAFLGQPLLIYAHHLEFRNGFDVLGEVAAQLNGLGDIQWMSLEQIVRRSYLSRQQGELLSIRMYSRRVELEVPDEVRSIQVEMPVNSVQDEKEFLVFVTDEYAHMARYSEGNTFSVQPGDQVSITMLHPKVFDVYERDPPKRIGLLTMRRRLCEFRDNARILIRV